MDSSSLVIVLKLLKPICSGVVLTVEICWMEYCVVEGASYWRGMTGLAIGTIHRPVFVHLLTWGIIYPWYFTLQLIFVNVTSQLALHNWMTKMSE